MRQFWPSIAQHLLPLLKQFSSNFINSPKFRLDASIYLYTLLSFTDDNDKFFATQTEFVSCLRVMLGIFEQCSPQLNFCLKIRHNQNMESLPLIASTLELPSVQASKNVHFLLPADFYMPSIYGYYTGNYQHSRQEQVKAIPDWLHRPCVSSSTVRTPQVEYTRSLTIGSTEREHRLKSISRIDIEPLIEDLKVVSFFI